MKPVESSTSFEKFVASVCDIHGALSAQASKAVNISLTLRNWLIGAYIAEYELNGTDRAVYGDNLLSNLAERLLKLNISNSNRRQLYDYLNFYRTYPQIVPTLSAQLQSILPEGVIRMFEIVPTVSAQSVVSSEKLVKGTKWSWSINRERTMAGNEIEKRHYTTFEEIKKVNENGQEFWSARLLGKILEYAEYRNFIPVIEKAKEACLNSGQPVFEQFVEVDEMIELGKGGMRKVDSYALSRYACYLIVQNGDPSKPVIANGQTYFAIQTRRQELADDKAFQQLKEDEKRLFLRNELREHNKQLVEAAQQAGVETNLDFAVFQNHGYKGLYGGLEAKDIHVRKGLKKSQKILDHMGSTELAANLFRATQAEEKLRRDQVKGKTNANRTHYEVGAKVRKTIEELGGTMPENLPTPEASAKKLERKQQKKLSDKGNRE